MLAVSLCLSARSEFKADQKPKKPLNGTPLLISTRCASWRPTLPTRCSSTSRSWCRPPATTTSATSRSSSRRSARSPTWWRTSSSGTYRPTCSGQSGHFNGKLYPGIKTENATNQLRSLFSPFSKRKIQPDLAQISFKSVTQVKFLRHLLLVE